MYRSDNIKPVIIQHKVDKTYGHAAYGCGSCCGYDPPLMSPGIFGGPPDIDNEDYIYATDTCAGDQEDVTGDGYGWGSSDTAVATLPNGTLHTVAVGLAKGNAELKLQWAHPLSCPNEIFDPGQDVNVGSVSCSPSSVTRGGTTKCTATGAQGSTFSNWKFVDSNGNPPVNGGGTSSTWSGVMVTSGTVSVDVTNGYGTAPVTAQVTVDNRSNFAFTAVNPTQAAGNSITCYSGQSTTLSSPPNGGSVGADCPDLAFSFKTSAAISDNGPNNGYQYVTSVSDSNSSGSQPTQFQYIVVTDLLSSTTFYNAQCGNYSTTNSTGYIAGSQLKQNVFDHEQGSVLSHWTEYVNAQNNSSNNVGTVLEAMTAPPNTSQSTFTSNLNSAAQTAINNIDTAVANEPRGGSPNEDSSQSCGFCGGINYSPYASCSGQPVPYCR